MPFVKRLGASFFVMMLLNSLLGLKPTDLAFAATPAATIEISDDLLNVGESLLVTIKFSESVLEVADNALTAEYGTFSPLHPLDTSTFTATFMPRPDIEDKTNVISLDNTRVTYTSGSSGIGTIDSDNFAIDTKRPTANIAVEDDSLLAGETSDVTFTFSEAVTGFSKADLTIPNGTLDILQTSDNITYRSTFTPSAGIEDTTNVIELNNSGVIDTAGNAGAGSSFSNNIAIDTIRPMATSIVVTDASVTAGETSFVTFTFTEAVTGFSNDDLTVPNGTLSDVSSSDGGITWTATFTPTDNINSSSNNILLDNTGITDLAGNAGTGTLSSANFTIDTIRPSATIDVADSSLRIDETSLVTIAFSEAVTGFSNDDLTVPNGSLSSVSTSDGGSTWTATFTPATDQVAPTNIIELDNSGVTNATGNPGTGTTESNFFAIDTKRPTATIAVVDTLLTKGETTSVTITFSEAVTDFANDDLSVPNGTLNDVSSSDGGMTWTATFTPADDISDSANRISLDNSGVFDLAGNTGTGTTDSNIFTINTMQPTSTIDVDDTSLTIDETSLVTITFTEAVTGFSNGDLSVSNGSLSPVSSSDGGVTWTATFTPTRELEAQTNVVVLDNTGVTNASGNAGTGTTASNNYAIDTKRPTAVIEVADATLSIGETAPVTITFSEAVTGFENDDLTIPNGTLSPVSSSDGGVTWTATFTPAADNRSSTNTIALDNSGITDLAGNPGMGTTDSNDFTIDTVRPTATLAIADSSLIVGKTSLVTITFSEAVKGFVNDDLTIANGTLSKLNTSDNITFTATFTPKADTEAPTNVIELDNTGVANVSGNTGTGTTVSNNYAVDTKRPTATIAVADSSLTIGETTSVTIAFSEAVTDFANDDLTIPNGTLSDVSSSDGGRTWMAMFKPTSNISESTNRISLDNSAVTDLAGNSGQGTTNSNGFSIDTVQVSNSGSTSSDGPIVSRDGRLWLPPGRSGQVSLDDEVSIYVPPGAANKELTITIAKLQEVQHLLTDDGFVLKSSIFEIQKNIPENFLIPVTMTFAFDPASLKSDQRADIYYYDEAKKEWLEIGGTVSNRHISVQTDHFTKFAVFAVTPPTEAKATYSDISGHWAEDAIQQAVSGGIVSGYPDGSFKPNRTVTRSEFAVMLMNAWKPTEEGTALEFEDAAQIPSWAWQAVAQAVQAGIINGYDDGSFRPDAEITRSEIAVMIAKALKLTSDPKATSGFADDRSIPSWAKSAAAAMKDLGIMGGSGTNLFNGSSKTTRAEAVTVLLRMLAQTSK